MDLSWMNRVLFGKLADRLAFPNGFQGDLRLKASTACISFLGHARILSVWRVPYASDSCYHGQGLSYPVVQFLGSTSVYYPAKGHYSKYKGIISGIPFSFKFEITKVEPVTSDDVKAWVPEHLEGTYVHDGFDDSSKTIPFTQKTKEFFTSQHSIQASKLGFRWLQFISIPLFALMCWVVFVRNRGR